MLSLSFRVYGVEPQGCSGGLPRLLIPSFARLDTQYQGGGSCLREGNSLTRTRLVPGMLGTIKMEGKHVPWVESEVIHLHFDLCIFIIWIGGHEKIF